MTDQEWTDADKERANEILVKQYQEIRALKVQHIERCLIQGCYYPDGPTCRYCGTPRPKPPFPAGTSPLETLRQTLCGPREPETT